MRLRFAWILAFALALFVGLSAANLTIDGDLSTVYLLVPLWLTVVAFAWSTDRRT